MSEQIDDIIYDLFNGNAIAEDEQKLIKSALKLREDITKLIHGSLNNGLEPVKISTLADMVETSKWLKYWGLRKK